MQAKFLIIYLTIQIIANNKLVCNKYCINNNHNVYFLS